MDIGPEQQPIIVEPVEDPFKAAPEAEPHPEPAPVKPEPQPVTGARS